MSFIGGQFLKNENLLVSIATLRDHGMYYHDFVHKAAKNGDVEFEDSLYYNANTTKFVYNKKAYPTFKLLDDAYPKGYNYPGLLQYPVETANLIAGHLTSQVVGKLTAEEAADPERVWNPLNCIVSGKHRLCLHTKYNAYYSSPPMTLPNLVESTFDLRNAHSAASHDLKSSYYQIALSKRTSKLCSFMYNNEAYEYLCLPFGSSPAVLIAQTLFGIIADLVRVVHKRKCVHFIDDFMLLLLGPDDTDIVLPLLHKHGLVLSDKSYRGTTPVFVGYQLDLLNNTFTVKPRTLKKIDDALNKSFSHEGMLWFTKDDLENLMGLLNFSSNVCIHHKTNCTNLIRSFRLSSASSKGFCVVDVRAYQEIVYWKEFVRHPVQ